MFINILLGITIVSLNILLVYYLYFFKQRSAPKRENTSFIKPISIIICAKNEEEHLKDNIAKILAQDYPVFEVIVVNDQSSDNTANVLKELQKIHPQLVLVTIEPHINHQPGKKFALTLGIKTAKYEYLLLTDADCAPNSSNWVKQMCRNFSSTDIVLGYGAYQKKKGFLNQLIRFDTFNVAQQYLSYALKGNTYMGVGRNLAYKKSLFFDNKGFANHMHISSGDDDLFIQEVATNDNVSIAINKEAHTISVVIDNWKDWTYQKRRHITTAPLYKMKFKILLSVYPYAQLLFWMSILLLFFFQFYLPIILFILLIKLSISYLVNYKLMQQLKIFDLYWLHPIYEVFHLLVQGIFVILNTFNKPKRW